MIIFLARISTARDQARGSGQEVFKHWWVEPGRVKRCSKYHGSGQVGFKSHGSGRAALTRSGPREVIRPAQRPVFFL